MSHVIGIDLGTVNSCVAIPESADIPRKDMHLADRRLIPAGGALVITNKNKERTTASAVWVDRDGTVLVGSRAKQMAGLSNVPPPALFFKRAMGTDLQVTAGYRTMTPEEASAHVLAHMKEIAEEVLGAPIHRAIVTVPAFFETKAKNLTTEAGERAGLEVVETLLEPVAAALMYTRTRQLADPATFMVYDLGGGTFDDSVVTWDPDIGFENRSFDGNQYLGGYDFDWKIVRWLIARPELSNYDLHLDPEDPRDNALRYKLLLLAEEAKHELSRQSEFLINSTTISDRAGNPMNIGLYLSRADFERMIEDDVRGTLASCERALTKAGVRGEDLSGVVMVGGSSRIPLVRQLLADEYHQEPVVIDPDLCVAVGAALKAATVAIKSSYLTVERPPGSTTLTSIDVSGRVSPGAALPSAGGVTVALSSDDGTFRRQEVTNTDGGFLFEEVELREEAENGFTVQVLAGGRCVDSQQLSVIHDWNAGARDSVPEGDILSKDFSVAVRNGQRQIASAGTTLPYRAAPLRLETATQRGEVLIEFYEENRPVANVPVPDLPPDLPIGSKVDVTLEFKKGWTITGSAAVPAAKKTVYFDFPLPKMAVPSWSELHQRYRQIVASWQEMRDIAPPAELLRVGPKIDDLLRMAKQQLDSQHDRTPIHHVLSEAATLLRNVRTSGAPKTALRPLLSEFEDELGELDRQVRRMEGKNATLGAEHRTRLEATRAAGRAAHEAASQLDWNAANENVRRQVAKVRQDLGEDQSGPPSAPIFQLMLAQELHENLDRLTKANRRSAGRFAARFDQLTQDAKAAMDKALSIDVSDGNAASLHLTRLLQTEVLPLREKIDQLMREAFPEVARGPGDDLRLPGARA